MRCPSGKVGYLSAKLAYKIERRMEKKGKKKQRAYRCNLCPQWHLTSGLRD